MTRIRRWLSRVDDAVMALAYGPNTITGRARNYRDPWRDRWPT